LQADLGWVHALSNAALPPAFQLEEKKNKNKNLKGFEQSCCRQLAAAFQKKKKEKKKRKEKKALSL
jgi:hypothetical protein